jgi:hypothetical protein
MAIGQDVEPRIVDHQGQALAPLFLAPANKQVSGFEGQRRRAPSRYRQRLAFPAHGVTQRLAHQPRAVPVMVLDQKLVALADVFGCDQQLYGDFPQHGLLVRRGTTK